MANSTASVFRRIAGVTVMLLATVTLSAVVLHAWQMRRASSESERQGLDELLRLGAAQASQAAEDATGEGPFTDRWSRQLESWAWAVTQRPAVLAAAWRDPEGRIRCVWPQEPAFEQLFAATVVADGSCELQPTPLTGAEGTVWVASCRLRPDPTDQAMGSLLLAARPSTRAAAWGLWTATFAVPLGGVAALSFIVGLRWLRRGVRDPLRTLVRGAQQDEEEWLQKLPKNRNDEFGGIARMTEDILGELTAARDRLQRLQLSLDWRVAAKTRDIQATLRDAQRQAWLDPLTQLGNRRLLEERLESLVQAQLSNNAELTVVMFDIDHFKQHNDMLGHAAGDELLRFFGQLLRSSLRDTDVGIRYAGDEFVVLLMDVGPSAAAMMAGRIIRLFAQHTSVFPTSPRATLSAGVASLRLCGVRSGHELLALADAALYQAKASGKNSVSVSTRSAQAPSETALQGADI